MGAITDFSSIAELMWMRNAGFSIAQCSTIIFVVNTPWGVRWLFGRVLDKWPNYIHFHYALICSISSIAWGVITLLTADHSNRESVVVTLLLAEFGPALGTTVLDGCMVSESKLSNTAASKCHRFRLIGRASAAYLGSLILHWFDVRAVFFCQQFLLIPVSVAGWYLLRRYSTKRYDNAYSLQRPEDEVRREEEERTNNNNNNNKKKIVPFVVFLLLVTCFPDANQSISYFIVGPLNHPPTTLGILESVSSLFAISGTFLVVENAKRICTAYSLVYMICSTGTILIVSRLAVGKIDDFFLLCFLCAFGSFFESALWTNFSNEIAKSAPEGSENQWYSTLATIPTIGRVIGWLWSLGLTVLLNVDHDSFDDLTPLVCICAMIGSTTLLHPTAFWNYYKYDMITHTTSDGT